MSKLERDIATLNQRSGQAIQERSVEEFGVCLSYYGTLIEAFFEKVWEYGERYPVSPTDKESRPHLFEKGSRPVIGPVIDAQWDIMTGLIQNPHEKLFEKYNLWLWNILNMALTYKDHLIYRTFLNVLIGFYIRLVKAKKMDPVTDKQIENLLRMVQEFANYRLVQEMEKTKDKDMISEPKEFSVETLLALDRLLYQATRLGNWQDFDSLAGYLTQAFRNFDPGKIQIKIDAQKEIEEVKKLIWFGLGGWALNVFRKRALDKDKFHIINQAAAQNLKEFREIFGVFWQAIARESIDRLGWVWWGSEGHPEGQPFSLQNPEDWLTWYYCYLGLKTVTKRELEEFTFGAPEFDIRRILLRVELICNEIKAGTLDEILESQYREKVDDFLQIHQRAVKVSEKAEVAQLIKLPISQRNIDELKKEFWKTFKERPGMRSSIEEYGSYAEKPEAEAPAGLKPLEINRLDDKAAYVERWVVSYAGRGQRFGFEMAEQENEHLMSAIRDAVKNELKIEHKERFPQETKEVIEQLKASGYKPNLIVVIGERDGWDIFGHSEGYTPRERRDYFHNIPIKCYHKENGIVVIVADFSKFARLVNYKVVGDKPHDIFSFSVEPFDEEKAKQLIEVHPSFLEQFGGDEEGAIHTLLQRVQVKIFERFELKILDANAAVKVVMAPPEVT